MDSNAASPHTSDRRRVQLRLAVVRLRASGNRPGGLFSLPGDCEASKPALRRAISNTLAGWRAAHTPPVRLSAILRKKMRLQWPTLRAANLQNRPALVFAPLPDNHRGAESVHGVLIGAGAKISSRIEKGDQARVFLGEFVRCKDSKSRLFA